MGRVDQESVIRLVWELSYFLPWIKAWRRPQQSATCHHPFFSEMFQLRNVFFATSAVNKVSADTDPCSLTYSMSNFPKFHALGQ
jgi:hypothetical protein